MGVTSQLQQLGFSQYEAQAYVALLRTSPLNGYELAKASRIPRANIYAVLQKLEEAGAVTRFATLEGVRYVPVPASELIEKLGRRYQQSLEAAELSLQEVSTLPDLEPVINIREYAELVDQGSLLVERAERYLLVSLWPEEALPLQSALRQAQERGVQIITLCLRGCPDPCPACQGAVYRYAIAPEASSRWLILVADDRELLAGEISSAAGGAASKAVTAVRTRQPLLVHLSASYIKNSIALATILTRLGRSLSELDPQDCMALDDLNPFHTPEKWLEGMKRKLHLQEAP